MYEGSAVPGRLSASRELLRLLIDEVGTPGAAAMRRMPRLLAEVDQHAAEVRDALGDGRTAPSTVALAGYTEGLIHAAEEAGWEFPASIDWAVRDWRVVRLLAICLLASDGREL
ncbi:hypothetical protein HC028_25590 [Planosporangium flavigriseum]|uniref:Uncharacterized protein n=1 Tax=Planosporangium flavigriseum TaxID=373681 RepID=A0A8J3LYY0_9ACTN|nr:DUF6401 family natural product biosynthesis protein [Planosporangium flavigriseum]NJC67852.1 hypothetical protein [Planosporangium flavigriseum]GIG76329.1 hypothetical protein Pfl04_47330 [Planosporangium flavigriseum]